MSSRKDMVSVATALYIVHQMGPDGADEFSLTTDMLRLVSEFAVSAAGQMLTEAHMDEATTLCAAQIAAQQFQQANRKGEVH